MSKAVDQESLGSLHHKNHLLLLPQEGKSLFLTLCLAFLENFNLVLYAHLAILLIPRFFGIPLLHKSSLALFSLCVAYMVRPLSAPIFGYLGQRSHKHLMIVSGSVMGVTMLTMGCLFSDTQASSVLAFCICVMRLLQGLCSMNESIAAKVLTINLTQHYFSMNFLSILPDFVVGLASLAVFGLSIIAVSFDVISGWRLLFFLGFIFSILSLFIRLKLLKTGVFLESMHVKKDTKATPVKPYAVSRILALQEKDYLYSLNYWYYAGIEALSCVAWYFSLCVCTDFLIDLGMNTVEIMRHNFVVFSLFLLFMFFTGYVSVSIDPFKLLKRRYIAGLCVVLLMFVCGKIFYHHQVFIFAVQLFILCAFHTSTPILGRVISSFPIKERCAHIGSAYTISQALMYGMIMMGFFMLHVVWSDVGVVFLLLCVGIIGLYCAYHFVPISDPDALEVFDSEVE